MKYTENDFKNARFATHPDGRIGARVDSVSVLTWVVSGRPNYDWRTDAEMHEDGWKPVDPARRITDADVTERFENASPSWRAGFNSAIRALGVTVHPTPEPTNAEKWQELLTRYKGEATGLESFGDWADRKGLKAPESEK